ncbi:diguanylate cyclase/phosphodiesterase (GGDEF & EAL domains) with PAS/PAC sensor(s) [plant metagenome]|uniref:Diguanylate cyclase/phosphodiesterase (GGDEF & EAL domains) with PAS/PAC sensor(S) n=1 Tax=plant metagenome TaxID=1297885 RepID=A0A484NY28_9ZZZZ
MLAGAVVLAACLAGLLTRPVGFLAFFWPANALLLGLMIRVPGTARPYGWLAAGAAYMAADLIIGTPLLKNVILNAANLAGVGLAYAVYTRLPPGLRRLRHPASLLHLMLVAVAGGAAAGVIGGLANPILFGRSVISGWVFWCVTEIVNFIAILPALLSAPTLAAWPRVRAQLARTRWTDYLPVLALALSCLAALLIGGPGTLAFPVPALLWCALAYPVFPTAVLTSLFGFGTLSLVAAMPVFDVAASQATSDLISARLGISLVALAPIMLAIAMQNRNRLMARLQHLAAHDTLTGVANRGAFQARAQALLSSRHGPAAALMIDLDHFKRVNDTVGHAGGDAVLVTFSQRVAQCLRRDDVLGRVGGEEFAVCLPDCPARDAIGIAERIRAAVKQPIRLRDGRQLTVTASVGLSTTDGTAPVALEALLAEADARLYDAKSRGRDRVEGISPG